MIDRIPGEQTRDTVEKLKPFLPAAVNEGVANFLGSVDQLRPTAADEVDRDIYASREEPKEKRPIHGSAKGAAPHDDRDAAETVGRGGGGWRRSA